MKIVLSAITALCVMICSFFTECTSVRDLPNEADSVKNLCAVSISDFDYDFYKKNYGYGYRINGEREIMIGNKEDGMLYDGESAYQFINGKKIATKKFPFEKIDTYAQEILEISQQIIQNRFYSGYNDERKEYRYNSYRFRITREGLALFTEHKYAWGIIDCIYRDGVFEYFSLNLYTTKEASDDFTFTFGEIPYTISYS